MEGEDGIIHAMQAGKMWMEMSTTDESEVRRLAALVNEKGGMALESPVSGGCHRAATGDASC